MTTVDVIDDLCLRNRAYQVLYALGDSDPATLYPGEAAVLVGIVQQLKQEPITVLDRILLSKMSKGMIEYVAGESFSAFEVINSAAAPVPTRDELNGMGFNIPEGATITAVEADTGDEG